MKQFSGEAFHRTGEEKRSPLGKLHLVHGLTAINRSISGENKENLMSKCPICGSRKGKRKCLIKDSPVCTLCCGETRKEETCRGCSFYKEPSLNRKYNEVPAYSTKQMEASDELQEYANAIEGAICAFDQETDRRMNDTTPIRVIELLLDKYHFQDESMTFDDDLVERAFHYVKRVIEMDLSKVPTEKVVKVLGVIRFVAKRRSREGGREYLEIINQYVGSRIAPGARIIRNLQEEGFGV